MRGKAEGAGFLRRVAPCVTMCPSWQTVLSSQRVGIPRCTKGQARERHRPKGAVTLQSRSAAAHEDQAGGTGGAIRAEGGQGAGGRSSHGVLVLWDSRGPGFLRLSCGASHCHNGTATPREC